jgi:hypothetical protein
MALLTALSFIGVALVQSVSGWMMALADEMKMVPGEQYRLLFILLAGVLGLATLVYCFSARRGQGNEPLR